MVMAEGSLAPPQTWALMKVRDGESWKSPPRWHRRTRASGGLTPLPVQAPAVAGMMFSKKRRHFLPPERKINLGSILFSAFVLQHDGAGRKEVGIVELGR